MWSVQADKERNNKSYKELIKFVDDRPFNDKVYKIDCSKLHGLNWKAKRNLENDIPKICEWYRKNLDLFNNNVERLIP